MLLRSLSKSTGHFLWPSEFENVANPDLENLKHLQNPGHLPLTETSITPNTYIEGLKKLELQVSSRWEIAFLVLEVLCSYQWYVLYGMEKIIPVTYDKKNKIKMHPYDWIFGM